MNIVGRRCLVLYMLLGVRGYCDCDNNGAASALSAPYEPDRVPVTCSKRAHISNNAALWCESQTGPNTRKNRLDPLFGACSSDPEFSHIKHEVFVHLTTETRICLLTLAI